MPKVSVIMPIYNTKDEYLRQAIKSILEQSYEDYEFIILNDSPKNLPIKEIVFTYQDSRIKYFENEQTLGVAKSYNRLLDLAKGDFVAVMNHDDISNPQRIEKQVSYLENHPEVGLVGTAYKKFGEINRFKTIENPKEDAEIRALLLFKSSIHHPTTMYRRHLVEEHHIRYKEEYVSLNDRKFYYDIGQYAKLANMPDVLYRYRFHKDMVSKKMKPEIFEEQCDFHAQWFTEAGIELTEEEKEIFDKYVTKGKCHIKDVSVLEKIEQVLSKISKENQKQQLVPTKEFSEVCGRYLVKRCLNAIVFGGVNSSKLLKKTELPIANNLLLKTCNLALHWRG